MRTPMPLAYSIHLQMCVWLYLLSLPFQIIADLGPWWTIPVTGLAGICFIGILAIGFEIENPFGYDANDLVRQMFNWLSMSMFITIWDISSIFMLIWVCSLWMTFVMWSGVKFKLNLLETYQRVKSGYIHLRIVLLVQCARYPPVSCRDSVWRKFMRFSRHAQNLNASHPWKKLWIRIVPENDLPVPRDTRNSNILSLWCVLPHMICYLFM